MALASKVSIYALALALPLAALIYYLNLSEENRSNALPYILRNLILAGIIAFVYFPFLPTLLFHGTWFLWFADQPELAQ